MTPIEASKKKNESAVYFNLYGDMKQLSPKSRFNIGDKVRISKYKRKVFDKGYTPNWTEEIFLVDKIQSTNPITYRLKDLNNEKYKAAFMSLNYFRQNRMYFALKKSTGGIIRRNKLW